MGREEGWTFNEWNRGVPWSLGTISEWPFLMIIFVQGTHICTYKGRYIFNISNNISFVMAKEKPFRTVYAFPF